MRNVLSNLGFVFQRPGTPALQDIFEKIREAIHKNGIRTTEFFKDHDKLRSGEITENQVRKFFSYMKSSITLALSAFLFFSFFLSLKSASNPQKCKVVCDVKDLINASPDSVTRQLLHSFSLSASKPFFFSGGGGRDVTQRGSVALHSLKNVCKGG